MYDDKGFSPNWGLNTEVRFQDTAFTSGYGFVENYNKNKINRMRASEREIAAEVSGLYTGVVDHEFRVGVGADWQDLYRVKHRINFKNLDGVDQKVDGKYPMTFYDVSGTDMAFAPEQDRLVEFAFLQDTWALSDALELTAGARYDRYSDFGGALSPRLAFVWTDAHGLSAKAMDGEGFRAPGFKNLHDMTASWALGNPDLEPELTRTVELAIGMAANHSLTLDINVFGHQTTNCIRAVDSVYQNAGDFNILGLELATRWAASRDLTFVGNISVRQPDGGQNEDGSILRKEYEPNKDAYLRMDWRLRRGVNWNVELNWTADRRRKYNDERPDMDDNLLVDSTLVVLAANHWELTGSVRNLFNLGAFEHTGKRIKHDLPLPRRNYSVNLRYLF